jgi:PKD repeat protein
MKPIITTMKRLLYSGLILPLMLISCEMEPESAFFSDTIEPIIGQEVFFTNTSFNADYFEWNFGDGTGTDVPNPVHVFAASGTYRVSLTAYGSNGHTDMSYIEINVKAPTLLEIEVLEYYDEYPVEDASVILYPTLADWDAERNMIAEGFTNSSGKVVFSGLGSYVFYVDVWEANHNNYTLRDEDVGFIRTDQIRPNEINRFIAYVDYVGNKGAAYRDRKMKIVSIVSRKTENR